MATLVVETTEGVALSREIAGAGSRGVAAAVDLLLWGTGLGTLASLLALVARVDPTGVSQFATGLLAGGALVSLVLYPFLFGILWDGRTPGKALLGLRVRDAQGRRAAPVQHLLRALFLPLELLLLVPAPLGLVLVAATGRAQRLGDLVAGTVVLRDPARGLAVSGPREGGKGARRGSVLSPALAARFEAEDLALLRLVLGRAELELPARRALVRRAAAHYAALLGREAPRSADEARAFLRRLYLDLRERRGTRVRPDAPEVDG